MGFNIKPMLSATTDLSRTNYRHYTLLFSKYSEMRIGDNLRESFRVQVVPNVSTVLEGPIISMFDAKLSDSRLYLNEFNIEPYTSIEGEQLQLALKCLIYALHKFCKVNKIKELAIDHTSVTLNEAARASGWYPSIDRKSGDTIYMLRSICC